MPRPYAMTIHNVPVPATSSIPLLPFRGPYVAEKKSHVVFHPFTQRIYLLSLWEDVSADGRKSSRKMSGRGRGDLAIFTEGCCHLAVNGGKAGGG